MKITLTYKQDVDGNWYHIKIDGSVVRSIKEHPAMEIETFKRAQEEFDRIKEFKGEESIIREEEL